MFQTFSKYINEIRIGYACKLLQENQINDILVTGGGIIPEIDNVELTKLGVGKLFNPGTSTTNIVAYINDWVYNNRNF